MIDSLRLPMTRTSMNSAPCSSLSHVSIETESLTKHITQIRRAFRAVHFNRVVPPRDENGMRKAGTRAKRENNGTRRVEKTGSSIEIGIAPTESLIRIHKQIRSHELIDNEIRRKEMIGAEHVCLKFSR